MRILSIQLRNLNSLKGDWTLNFTEGPLAQSGLFAITGDTGAGKTTLLDAITLALYGETARKHSKEVLTYGETESLAEVVFEGISGRYRAHWSQAYKGKKKKSLKAERRLEQLDEETGVWEIIDSSTKSLKSTGKKKGSVELATGLDFSQFCKSVLLPQGDFAAFLTANDAERAAILERLTDAEIYGKLSIAAFQRHKREKAELDLLEVRLNEHNISDDTAIETLEAEGKQLQSDVKKQVKILDALRKNRTWLETVADLERKKETLRTEKKQLATKHEAAAEDFERLALHEAALPFQPDVRLLDAVFTEKETLVLEQKEATSALSSAVETLKNVETALERSKNKVQTIQSQKAEKESRWKLMSALDSALQLLDQQNQNAQKIQQETRLKAETVQNLRTELSLKNQNVQNELEDLVLWKKEHPQAKNTLVDVPLLHNHRDTMRSVYVAKGEAEKKKSELVQKIVRLQTRKNEAEAVFAQKKQTLELLEKQVKICIVELELGDEPRKAREILETRIELEKAREKSVETLLAAKTAYHKKLSELSDWRNEQEKLLEQEFSLHNQIYGLVHSVDIYKKELDQRTAIFEQQQQLVDYDRDRKRLEAGQPCPLCGALEHPFRVHFDVEFVDVARADMEKAQKSYEALKLELSKALKEHGRLATFQTPLNLDIEAISEETPQHILTALEQDEALISDLIPKMEDLALGSFTEKTIGLLLEKTKTYIETLLEAKAKLDQLLFAKDSAQDALRQAENQLNSAQKESDYVQKDQESLQKEIESHEKSIQKEAKAVDVLLKKYGLHFDEKTFKNTLLSLGQQHTQYSDLEQKEQTLRQQQQRLNGEMESLEKQHIANQTALQESQNNCTQIGTIFSEKTQQRTEQFGTTSVEAERTIYTQQVDESSQQFEQSRSAHAQAQKAQIELKSKQESIEKRLAELHIKIELANKEIAARLNSSVFDSLDALRLALLPEKEAEGLAQQKKQQLAAEQNIAIQYQTVLQSLEKAALEPQQFTILEDLVAAELEQNQLYEQCQNRIGAVHNQLEIDRTLKTRFAELTQKIAAQSIEEQQWRLMNGIIGSATGNTFRVFAQSLTLLQLISLANQHLEKLNNRYFIKKKEGESLELEIIDRYQADNVRSMNTLSGGETFIASLALALGLSSLANKKANIQSLFIDEGFGALDESALDMAISALENLQSMGLTIGIVSHVRGLKERIATQVVVRKKGNGHSMVEVI